VLKGMCKGEWIVFDSSEDCNTKEMKILTVRGFNARIEERFVDFSCQLLTIEKLKRPHVLVG
jgi:hypothetical protein